MHIFNTAELDRGRPYRVCTRARVCVRTCTCEKLLVFASHAREPFDPLTGCPSFRLRTAPDLETVCVDETKEQMEMAVFLSSSPTGVSEVFGDWQYEEQVCFDWSCVEKGGWCGQQTGMSL